MKFKPGKIILLLALLLLPIFAIKAASNEKKGSIYVPKDEIISGNLLAAGDSVIVDGTISGDLIAAANYITVSGRVEGDIIAIAQDINLGGEVGGNIRVAGNSVSINSLIARNLNAFGSRVIIGSDARIGWDALLAGVDVNVRGNISGDLDTYSEKAYLSGKVGKNADLHVYNGKEGGNLILENDAKINGNLNYYAKEDMEINNKEVVSGEILFNQVSVNKVRPMHSWTWNRLFSFLSMLLIGLVLVFITKRYAHYFVIQANLKTGNAFLWGAGATLLVPPLALLAAITIIGLPLSLILICLWAAGILIGKTVAAVILGDLIMKKVFKKDNLNLFWHLLIGSIILTLLLSIPLIGWLIGLVAVWLGWGAMLSYAANKPENI